ncbi:hypothetical protein LOZ53_002263 [Ophidiomyces ophidiicola]|nr:hypothetical protein LOZ55_001113 [Ophidiomyces ophidiicola]KAI1988762.1 hypothetical protein LOZ54_003086 [Ophidiomyces ophidiicola]KAI1993075.1 hypothetical protein LOZ53_002263 [Ophidiomyces ophidiicola]KAI1995537.1 hypothetical protein LOZ51_003363 [Ophidiomyces ophidiicola]KAI2014514.1 hypothetical protein LOZ49_001261 [Ophidiomyces ophidiicola]
MNKKAPIPGLHTDIGQETLNEGKTGGIGNIEPTHKATPSSDGSEGIPQKDIPPDGGYGWVCVACAAFINGNTWGVNSSYGVFLSYYLSHDIFPNMSPIAYAFTGGLSMSCALLISPLVTHLIHLYGNRIILNIGVCLQTISFIGASFAKEQWHLFLSQGVCFGLGMGCIFIGSVGITPQWFYKKRSVANAIAAAGSGLGGLAYSLGAGAMIPRLGLGWTFRVLGITTFVINITACNLLRDRNKAVGSRYRAFHFPLLKRPEFIFLQLWGIFSLLGYVVVLFSLPNFALSIGLSAHQGSIVGALLNLGQGLGRPVVGLVSDRLGRINMATAFTLFCGLLCFAVWIPSFNMGVLSFFAIIVGTVAGTFWTTVVPVCAEVIGMQELPAGLSISWVLLVPPTTIAEPIAVLLKSDSKQDWIYLYAQIFAGLTYVIAGISLWLVRGWKVGEMEMMNKVSSLAANTPPVLQATVGNAKNTAPHSVQLPENKSQHQNRIGTATHTASASPTQLDTRLWSPASLFPRMLVRRHV